MCYGLDSDQILTQLNTHGGVEDWSDVLHTAFHHQHISEVKTCLETWYSLLLDSFGHLCAKCALMACVLHNTLVGQF